MLTKKLLGTAALAAFLGTAALAQDVMEMPNDGRYEIQMDAAGAPMMDPATGEPVVIDVTTGQPADPETYRLDGDEIILLMADTEVETDAAAATATTGTVVEGAATTGAVAGGDVIVEQGEATVDVDVPDPVVTVDQAAPEVTVEQPQPEIVVQQSPPQVEVQQQAPVITVTQAQPVVTVRIPEPIVTVRMPQPEGAGRAGSAHRRRRAAPAGGALRAPRAAHRRGRGRGPGPRQPGRAAGRHQPHRAGQRHHRAGPAARSQVEEAEAQVTVTDAEPVVDVQQAEGADVQVEQAEAQVDVQQAADAEVVVIDPADPRRQQLVEGGFVSDPNVVETEELRTQRIGAYGAYGDSGIGDLLGRNVLAAGGEDIGEVDEFVRMNDRLYAVVGVGGFLGIGERNVAVPLERMAVVGDDFVIEGLTGEQLEAYPEYDASLGETLPAEGRFVEYYESPRSLPI